MRITQVSKKSVAMGWTFTMALAVAVISGVPARAQVGPKTLVKHVLSGTYYDASSSGATASCDTADCVATANMYTESIACPGAVDVKCTYEVNIAALTSVSQNGGSGYEGLYQFLIDGAAPTGGGTDSNGFYAWGEPGAPPLTSAFSVTSQVKNASANQLHSIVVNLGCSANNSGGGGCDASAGLAIDPRGFASLTVRVLKP
jgi:hypothetical protein